jgi:SAM-dependent methyltransferase
LTTRLKKDTLSQGHRKAIGHDDTIAYAPTPSSDSSALNGKYTRTMERFFTSDRVELLKDIPPSVVKKAWFIMSHALLNAGSKVLDAGCNTGEVTYVMAVLNPQFDFIGLDVDPASIKEASAKYKRPNLQYQVGNIYTDLPENSFDLIVNSFFLHEIYSASFYNDRLIQMALEKQYKALKDRGSLVIRDYLNPTPGEYVQLEFTDKTPSGETFETLSESELLIWFAEHARAKQGNETSTDCGFFLEELPPNYPRTRLFRIPAKWAYEFILRKDNREKMRAELSKEYAFYTEQEFRKHLRGLGARVAYTAPHWDEGFIKSRYTGAMRLYKEDGTKLGPPPTNYILVARKIAENTSQLVMERRTSRARTGSVYLRSVRDDKSGAISDIVCRDMEISEVLPFRVTPDNKLKIYLHEDVPRGLVNSVPRSGQNLDGRKWSGHMIEAIGVSAFDMTRIKDGNENAELQKFSIQHIGIKPSLDAKLLEGGGFYPDPNQIDERIVTYYYRVEEYHNQFPVKESLKDVEGFSSRGVIREFDAQEILNAISVGFIPTSRLEVQILGLFQMLGIKSEVWSDSPLQLSEIDIEDVVKISDVMKQYSLSDDRFKAVRGSAGNVRLVQSVFVDEGRDKGGGMAGLAARDLEFAVPENGTVNTAVVMALVKNLNGEVMAGVVTQYLPVPQRYNGTGQLLTLPSFPLPKEVTDIEAAKFFIAEQFKVKPEHVARMGESYFTHIGVTPHRIYPFVVTDMRGFMNGHTHGTTQVTMLKDLWKLCYWDNHDSFLKVAAIACQHLLDSDLTLKHDFDFKVAPDAQKSAVLDGSVMAYNGSGPTSGSSSSSSSSTPAGASAEEDKGTAKSSPTPIDFLRSPRNPL